MINNKVKINARKLWTIYDQFRIGVAPGERHYSVTPILDAVTEIAGKSSRSAAEMSVKLDEYMNDISKYIRDQARGKQSGVGFVFTSCITENDEGVSCVVDVKWGTMKESTHYIVDCENYISSRRQ